MFIWKIKRSASLLKKMFFQKGFVYISGTTISDNICSLIFTSSGCPTMKRYGYDKVKKSCEEFSFNGCFGNKNNYDSPADCEARHSK